MRLTEQGDVMEATTVNGTTEAATGQCLECGGALPAGRTRGRCMRCTAALARAGKAARQAAGGAGEADDSPRAELRALMRCVDAMGDLPQAARIRALRYLWALYGVPSTGTDAHSMPSRVP